MREYVTSTSVQCGLNWKARSQSSEFSCQSALETGHQVLDIHTVLPSSSQVKGAVKARTPHGTQAQAGSKGQGQNFTMLKLLCLLYSWIWSRATLCLSTRNFEGIEFTVFGLRLRHLVARKKWVHWISVKVVYGGSARLSRFQNWCCKLHTLVSLWSHALWGSRHLKHCIGMILWDRNWLKVIEFTLPDGCSIPKRHTTLYCF